MGMKSGKLIDGTQLKRRVADYIIAVDLTREGVANSIQAALAPDTKHAIAARKLIGDAL